MKAMKAGLSALAKLTPNGWLNQAGVLVELRIKGLPASPAMEERKSVGWTVCR